MVTATHDGRRRVIAAVDQQAARLGLHPGMPLAQARALEAGLTVQEADPPADQAALRRLAAWCLRYAPLTAVTGDGTGGDGIWIDATGTAHLHGGEAALLRDLISRLIAQGISGRAAIADTPGAAHAMARFSGETIAIVASGQQKTALAALPLAALRLAPATLDALRLMGIERIDALAAMPRAPLVRRFGAEVTLRLDQAFGTAPETIEPAFPPDLIQARLTFVEPLLTPEAFSHVIDRLVLTVHIALERSGHGARRLDLVFERVDGTTQAIRAGTAKASRNIPHLTRLLREKLETIDPGLGVEAMRLLIPRTDPLTPEQTHARLTASDTLETDIAPLIDRLSNRYGSAHVYQIAPVASEVPERSVRRTRIAEGTMDDTAPQAPRPRSVSPLTVPREPSIFSANATLVNATLANTTLATPLANTPSTLPKRRLTKPHPPRPNSSPHWPANLPRPIRLLDPPQPVEALALLPDHPPLAFTWRRIRHRVRRADGPERIAGEWWKRDGEMRSVRDYFRVEDEAGHRYWLFRRGDGENGISGDMRWFLHGFF